MIWFFLMGMIAGAVGMVMYAHWWIGKHVKKVDADEAIRDIEKMKEEKSDD